MLAQGSKEELLAKLVDPVLPGLQLNRIICISDDETLNLVIKRRLNDFGYDPQFVSYSGLATFDSRLVRGKSVLIISPTQALNESPAKGIVDGGLVKLLSKRTCRDILAFCEAKAPLNVTQLRSIEQLARWVSEEIDSKPRFWLDELVLTIVYRRGSSVVGIRRLVANSVWSHLFQDDGTSIEQARAELLQEDLVTEEGGYLVCTELGRRAVEENTPFDRIDRPETRERDEPDEQEGWGPDVDSGARNSYLAEIVLETIERFGWITPNDLAVAAERARVMPERSLGKSRRFLEKLVAKGTLVKSTYSAGKGRPKSVYRRRDSRTADILENKCGDCVFYSRVTRRCRLWWALSRFNAPEVYSREEELSAVSRDKLHHSNKIMGPSATSCEEFSPKKKDYPLLKARDKCVSCGQEIDPPIAKTVKCPACLTVYKPLATKILVHYDHEQLFKKRYTKLAGVPPPRQALVLTDQEFHGKTDIRDTIVLFPNENVRFSDEGMRVERREREWTLEPYSRIYQVIDYGSLDEKACSQLRAKGIQVVQTHLRELPQQRFPLYPSRDFVDKLRLLEQKSPLRTRLLESMMLSTIVATRRIASRGGYPLQVLINRQLLEYSRMKADNEMTLSRALAYEARVNAFYWSVYKTMLRVSGLQFESRVRDRFVREIVSSIRARARGYSPANAAINYLHQRRLLLCRLANARTAIGWVGCEGVLHVAKREPSIGLMLDLSDSFRLADRESFLDSTMRMELSRDDFVARPGKHRVWFFHPTQEAIGKLDLCGSNADQFRVQHAGKEMTLTGAYDEFVASFVDAVDAMDLGGLRPFVYGNAEDLKWLETKGLRAPFVR